MFVKMKQLSEYYNCEFDLIESEQDACQVVGKKLLELASDIYYLNDVSGVELSDATRAVLAVYNDMLRSMANKMRVTAGQEEEYIPLERI